MPTGKGDDAVPAHVARGWRQGEERLYLAALASPDVFERSVAMVGRTVEHLRAVALDGAGLLAAAAQGPALVARAGEGGGPDPAGLDLALVADAALALRHREVLAEQAARRRVHALREVRDRGGTWTLLEESGDASGDPFVPYRRLEAHARTGHALLVTTSPDEDVAGCLHAVEPLHVELRTGVLVQARDTRLPATVHPDAEAREQHADRVRNGWGAS